MDSETIESYKIDVINQINKYRNNHGSKKLINDPKIDNIAQKFAKKLSKTGILDYSSNEYKGQILGETVYKSENYFAPIRLVKALYDEIKEYNFKSKDPEPSNFSQMVWKNTDYIGFGMEKSSNGKYFYVINYYPTGNIDGEFKKNVFPEGTKLISNKKEEEKKNEFDNNKNCKYTFNKVVKEYKNNNNFDEDFEEFNKKFEEFDIDDDNEEYEEEEEDEKEIKQKNKKDMKNILSQLINNKKKEKSQEENNNKESYNNNQEIKSNSDFNSFCLEAVDSHNKFRKMHHVPPLKLNKDICIISENYAKTLATKLKCLQHSDNEYKGEPLGENLFCCWGMEVTGHGISKHWYDEIKKYNFNGDWQSGCGHFTQLVWKDTKEVGFGKWKDKNGKTYVVANYFPAGNYMGTFKYNVLKA